MTAREDQPQLGTCDKKQHKHAGPHELIFELADAAPDPCWNWTPVPEDQPLPTVSTLCRQTHHDFCAIPGCWCPCHADVEQKLTDAAFPAQVGGPLVVDLGTAIDIVATKAQGEAPQVSKRVSTHTTEQAGPHSASNEIGGYGRVETGAHPSQDALREALRIHWLHQIECNHYERNDSAICACGWKSDRGFNVGKAVEFWIDHVFKQAGARSTPSLDPEKAFTLRCRCGSDFKPECPDCHELYAETYPSGSTPSPDPPHK